MSTLTEVMSKGLKTISSDRPVAEAARRMRDEHIGSLLVKKDDGFVGILTETDVVRKGVADGKDLTSLTTEQIMSSPMITIQNTRNIRYAHDMMGDLGVRHLVVMDAAKVTGVVSARDLLVYYKSVSEPNITQD